MGGHNIDIREAQWIAHGVFHFPAVTEEAPMERRLSMAAEPREIPYRSLLPPRRVASNLIVRARISESAVALRRSGRSSST